MSSRESMREDIARQFDLPERQSKIATLLKESDVYCICRSSDSTRFMIACDNCEEWYHGDCIKITDSEAKRIKHYFCEFCREQNPALKIEYKKPKVPSAVPAAKTERPTLASANLNVDSSPPPTTHSNGNSASKSDKKSGRNKKEHSSSSKSRKSGRRCGICYGCSLQEDCGKCDNCKSNARRRKYDSNAKSSKKCRQRQCVNSSRRTRTYSNDSEDYEPGTEDFREAYARALRYSDTDSGEEVNWEEPKPSRRKEKEKSSKRSKLDKKSSSHSQPQEVKVAKPKKKSHRKRIGEPWEDWSSAGEISEDDFGEKHCLGPECINETRPNSKYCSDDCGLKMASARIYNVLPGRIQEWSLTPCAAEEHNKKTLEEVRSKQANTQTILRELDEKREALDTHIENISKIKVEPGNFDEEPDDEGTMYCITCGHEVAIKTCLKHMEKCYNKYESQTSFASSHVTNLGGVPIFCDSYSTSTSTYCKRLKVLCPEHTKDPKVRDTAICGCPLVKNLTGTGEFCQAARKKCNRHFCWEKLRRAEIDMERVRFWVKLDELQEQERTLRAAMTNRAGVMALLLHSTFDHDIRNRIQRQIEEQHRERERRLSRDKGFAQRVSMVRPAAIPPPPPTPVDVKPIIEVDMNEILFKEPLPSKRDKASRRAAVGTIKEEPSESAPAQQMTASKLYKQQKTDFDF